jgi:regulator of protease activity HflC (stomatin/prohibitin superfamily)
MLTIIILTLLGIATLGALGAALVTRSVGAVVSTVVLALCFVVFWGVQSFKVIGANEVGIPVTFGKAGDVIDSGPEFVAPWTEVETYPTRPRTMQVVANVRTSEQGHVAVTISARWATSREHARDLFLQARSGDDEKIQREIIGPNISGAAGAYFGGLLNVDAVNGQGWEKNAAGVEAKATQHLARYGITVDTVQIRQVKPDETTDAAISRIAAQQRETQVAKESKLTADAQAAQRLAEAAGIKNAADQYAALTPTQVQLLCLQASERVLNKNFEKGIATYTLPCQSGGTPVIANAK